MISPLLLPHDRIILDTCCVINCHASGRFSEVLTALPRQATISEYVRNEIERGNSLSHQPASGPRVAIDLQPLVIAGLLAVVRFESEAEEDRFVLYAHDLDDGEAATAAIAVGRNWCFASDERKARRIMRETASQIQQLSTPELMKHWAESNGTALGELNTALRAIQGLGRYRPGTNHALYEWWQDHVG